MMAYSRADQVRASTKWRNNHREHSRKLSSDAHKKARERNARFIVSYFLDHPCVDCGESDPIVLEFDHVRGEKEDSVAALVNHACSIERLRKEVDKCEVRCANCHRRRTAQQRGWIYKIMAIGRISNKLVH
jgi:hypothetical protein